MKKNSKLIALLLAVLMTATLFAGCSGGEDPDKTSVTTTGASSTSASASASDSGTTTEPTTVIEPVDLDGYEFTLVGAGKYNYVEAAEMTARDSELRDIYDGIEEELNCSITFIEGGTEPEDVTPKALGGDKYADFLYLRQYTWIPCVVKGYVRPLDTEEVLAEGLDYTNEDNFNQQYTLMSTMATKGGTHVYGLDISGKYAHMSFGHTYAFNKNLCDAAGYPAATLYDAVRNGTWNYDMMIEVANAISNDTTGDGVNDVWGIALDCDGNEIWTNGTGPIILENNKWVMNLSDPRVVKSMEFMQKISGDPNLQISLVGDAVASRGDRRKNFYNGICGFAGLYGPNYNVNDNTGTMADDFGLLPIPKGPDVDTYKMNIVDTDHFVILFNNSEWKNAVKVMNAIGEKLCDKDAYKDYILESLRGDEDALEMLFEYCLPNAQANIAKCTRAMYDITRYEFYDAIYKGNLSPSGAAEAWNARLQAELDTLFGQ